MSTQAQDALCLIDAASCINDYWAMIPDRFSYMVHGQVHEHGVAGGALDQRRHRRLIVSPGTRSPAAAEFYAMGRKPGASHGIRGYVTASISSRSKHDSGLHPTLTSSNTPSGQIIRLASNSALRTFTLRRDPLSSQWLLESIADGY